MDLSAGLTQAGLFYLMVVRELSAVSSRHRT